MDVYFYQFEKKPNSTKRPTGTGTIMSCEIFAPCSVLSPVIIVAGEDPTDYNYVRIPKWGRYYFVTDWSFVDGRWRVSLQVDALASYRPAILSSSQYVSRSASAGNNGIRDEVYPTYGHPSVNVESKPSPWETGTDGTYVIGVLGGGGQTSFYALSQGALDRLIDYIFSDAYADAIFGSGAWVDMYPELKTQLNPLQYISSIIWYPISIGGLSHTIKVGWVNTPVSGNLVSPKTLVTVDTVTMSVPNHPQGGAWSYLNTSPYSEYFLYYPPFGLLPLDSQAMMREASISASVTVDPIAGQGFLVVKAGEQVILRTESSVGQRVQLGQITAPGNGAATIIQGAATAVSGVANIVSAVMGGDPAKAVARGADLVNTGVNGFRGVAENKIPSTSTMGSSTGGYPALVGNVEMISSFLPVVAKDPEHKGTPYCAYVPLSSLSGYIEVFWPHLEIGGNVRENQIIYSQMERGLYLE